MEWLTIDGNESWREDVGGQWEMSTPTVGLTTSCDHSIDVQCAVVVSRAAICASSGEGSLLGSVDIEDAVSVWSGGISVSLGEGSP